MLAADGARIVYDVEQCVKEYEALTRIERSGRAVKTPCAKAERPAGPAVPGEGLRLIWSLLLPFAPLLARSFLERTGGWPAPSLEKLAEPFLPRRAVRVALERGGWNWVVVDARRFETEPGREIAGIGWIAEALGDRPWTVRSEVEGWRVCLSRTPTTAANS